jgi:AP-3 complex subunit sigma
LLPFRKVAHTPRLGLQTLDKCFENVCELDLIFHADKVHYILDEVIMGGMVLETNINEILESIIASEALCAQTRGATIKA